MAIGLQLSQRMTQSLVLAPQLQHSLALLQAPTLELKALVEQELEQNPVLEEVAEPETESREKPAAEDADAPAEPADDAEPSAGPADDADGSAEPADDITFESPSEKASDAPVDDFQAEFNRLVQLDQEWREHFSQTNTPLRQTVQDEEKRQFMFDSLTAGTSLAEALMDQVRESELTDEQRKTAELIVGNIDDHGYLKATL